jgi:hypothetical protein
MTAKGMKFPVAPKKQEYGGFLAQFQDSEGVSVSVSGKWDGGAAQHNQGGTASV